MNTLVLTNPNSYRVQRNLPRLLAMLEQMTEVEHCVSQDLVALDRLLEARKWQPDDLIVVNGGDGTVHHLLTRLVARYPVTALPQLAILPAGTTNMTAVAFNQSRSFRSALSGLKKALHGDPPKCQERQLLHYRS